MMKAQNKKAPAGALSTVVPVLFVQFCRHMHAVTGEGFGDGVEEAPAA